MRTFPIPKSLGSEPNVSIPHHFHDVCAQFRWTMDGDHLAALRTLFIEILWNADHW